MALPQVQGYRAQVAQAPSAATPAVSFGQQVRADVAVQAQAQYQNTLSQVLDRLSNTMFGQAEVLAEREGWQFALDKKMTAEQFAAAAAGNAKELNLGSPLNVFNAAVQKARAIEISFHAEAEAREKGQELLARAEKGEISTEDAVSQLTAMMDGYTKTLSQISPDASYKFRASISTIGSRIVDRIAERETQRARLQTNIKLNQTYQNFLKEVNLWSEGNLGLIADPNAPNGERRLAVGEAINNWKEKFLLEVSQLASPEIYNQYASRIDADIFEAKANVITMGIIEKNSDIGGDAFSAMNRLMTGNAGKFQEVFNSMTAIERASMRVKIHKAFTEMVDLNNADRAMAKQRDEDAARKLISSYIVAPDKKILDDLMRIAITTGAVTPEYVAKLPETVADMRPRNAMAEIRLKDEISRGLITSLDEFLSRGSALGISVKHLNTMYDLLNPAERQINSSVERDARSAARIIPNSATSYRKEEAYHSFIDAVEIEFSRQREAWEASGRKGMPPIKSDISSKIMTQRRMSPISSIITGMESDLKEKYGSNGSVRKTNINFDTLNLKYDESTGTAIGLDENAKALLLHNGFNQSQIDDVEQSLMGIDAQRKQLDTIRLPQ